MSDAINASPNQDAPGFTEQAPIEGMTAACICCGIVMFVQQVPAVCDLCRPHRNALPQVEGPIAGILKDHPLFTREDYLTVAVLGESPPRRPL